MALMTKKPTITATVSKPSNDMPDCRVDPPMRFIPQ
jgi:hypothetical protein